MRSSDTTNFKIETLYLIWSKYNTRRKRPKWNWRNYGNSEKCFSLPQGDSGEENRLESYTF